MGGIKSGGLLLILAIPMGLYAVWAVNGVVRTDLVISDPPPDRGSSREQLTAARTKTTAWAGEVGKAIAMSQQYRAATPQDASPDADAAVLMKASAVRAADLNDLDAFLSDTVNPDFTGKLKPQYLQWREERKELKRDADAITNWLNKPPAINSAADASTAGDDLRKLITNYTVRSKFSDKAKAALWQVDGRLKILKALTALADAQYSAAVKAKLPLEQSNAVAVKTLAELKAQIAALRDNLRNAEDEKAVLPPDLLLDAKSKGSLADECAAREELLALFAKDDLFTNPSGADAWLKQVAKQYRRTKDEKVRQLIRDKVQEFCDAFIPAVTRLDDKVMIRTKDGFKTAPRKEVVVKFEVTVNDKVETKRIPLGELEGMNEFNLVAKPPGANVFVVFDGREDRPRDMVPTDLSKAAVMFNGERKKLTDSTSTPKWTANSVEQLKKKCEAQKELVDQLQTPDGQSAVKTPKIWTRLAGLAAGMVGNTDLFDVGP